MQVSPQTAEKRWSTKSSSVEKESRLATCQVFAPLQQTKKTQTNKQFGVFCFVFTAPRCVMTIHPLQVKEKLYLACKMWDQERETNTSLCRRANPAHMQWFWKNPLESISQMSLMFSKQYQPKGDKGPALWPARHVVALLSQSERVWRTPLASHRPDTVLLLGLSITYRRTATSQKGYMTL